MSVLITSLICSLILNFTIICVIKKIMKSDIKIFRLKKIILIILLSILQTVFYNTEYNITYILTNYLAIIIFNKLIFRENMIKTMISTMIVILFMMLSDFINSIIMVNFFDYNKLRSTWLLRIISNIDVAGIIFIISSINFIKKRCIYFIDKFEYKKISIILSFLFLISAIVLATYEMTSTFNWTPEYFSNIFIVLTLIVFFYIFINENNQYNKLNDEYDNLFKCIQTFEDWIEKEQLNRHEYKNQLAVLRCLTKEKKVKEKIDNIISDNININNDTINQLKPIPNGGLKGLLYYKIVIAEKNKIKLETDVSLNSNNILTNLSEEKMKIICRLIGIYFDNAIEAAKETRKRIVSLEVYEYDNSVNIVISNTFKKNRNINKRNEKGFTTKGKGHGNGLYFAKKMINNNSWIREEQSIISNFYTQKIIIQKETI